MMETFYAMWRMFGLPIACYKEKMVFIGPCHARLSVAICLWPCRAIDACYYLPTLERRQLYERVELGTALHKRDMDGF